MFYLTIDTPGYGHMQALLAAKEQESHPAGCWVSEIGRLNQVLTLREASDDIPETASSPAAPIRFREVRLLSALKPYRPTNDKLFELREYAVVPGRMQEFIALMLEALPFRERHSPNVCVWVPLSGDPDRVLHLWGYRDFAHRGEARAAAMREPAWQAYLKAIVPLLGEMNSTILRPVEVTAKEHA